MSLVPTMKGDLSKVTIRDNSTLPAVETLS
jgi:hypothetical protein